MKCLLFSVNVRVEGLQPLVHQYSCYTFTKTHEAALRKSPASRIYCQKYVTRINGTGAARPQERHLWLTASSFFIGQIWVSGRNTDSSRVHSDMSEASRSPWRNTPPFSAWQKGLDNLPTDKHPSDSNLGLGVFRGKIVVKSVPLGVVRYPVQSGFHPIRISCKAWMFLCWSNSALCCGQMCFTPAGGDLLTSTQ